MSVDIVGAVSFGNEAGYLVSFSKVLVGGVDVGECIVTCYDGEMAVVRCV